VTSHENQLRLMSETITKLSWERIHSDAHALATQLQPLGPWPCMVAITRGGLVPAGLIAQTLGIHRIETLGLTSYANDHKPGPMTITKPLPEGFDHQARLLVIDDLVDTGQSARTVRSLLPNAHIATLYAKPQGLAFVQSHVADFAQNEWIVFPWG
jgi:xanthine phosphoribosyltransferase